MQQLVVVVLYENNKGKILHTQYGIGQLMFIKKNHNDRSCFDSNILLCILYIVSLTYYHGRKLIICHYN